MPLVTLAPRPATNTPGDRRVVTILPDTPPPMTSDEHDGPRLAAPSPMFSVAPRTATTDTATTETATTETAAPTGAPGASAPAEGGPQPVAPAPMDPRVAAELHAEPEVDLLALDVDDEVVAAELVHDPGTPPPYRPTSFGPDTHAPAAHLPAATGSGGAGVTVARPNDGLPVVLDPYAVATRAVLVLIGSTEPAKHIARTAIELSIEHDSSAALDVVIPRAIDLVLRRAAHLVGIGAGPNVVDHYAERLELWRRLACRRGLEPAAIVLTLAPFPIPSVASMLRVPLAEVEACIDDWYAGIDPEDLTPHSITATPEPPPAWQATPPPPPAPVATPPAPPTERRSVWGRLRFKGA